jgi:DNA-binding transcriptional LysR family regulator
MTFQQVQYFLKIYETGNISAAAQELFLTRSALSKAIRELEDEFGCRFFERTNGGLVPTEAGEVLRLKGLELVSLMDETASAIRSQSKQSQQTIHIGITPTTGITVFPRIYRDFIKKYDDIQILPIEGGNAKAQNLLEAGRMDACITTYSEVFPDSKGRLHMTDLLDCTKLYDTELVFCAKREHPLAKASSVTVEDLLGENFVFLKKPLQREAEIQHRFMKNGAVPNVIFRASQLSIAREIVGSGMATSIQMRGTLEDGETIVGIPLEPAAPYANVLVWNRSRAKKPALKKFLEFCRSYDYSGCP